MQQIIEKRERELCHLKMMVDYHRHLALISFAAVVLTANLTIKLYEEPKIVGMAFGSILFFFVSVVSSMLAQIHHIDLVRKEVIYNYPLPHRFLWPMLLSMLGAAFGMVLLSGFVMVNWWAR